MAEAMEPEAVPEVAFTKLIWAPYRARVLGLMGRLLDGIRGPGPASGAAANAGRSASP